MLSCFFFQAEDGIRDRNVTGVQTCALPIYSRSTLTAPETSSSLQDSFKLAATNRSEERRVGKECRFRWPRVYRRKNNRSAHAASAPSTNQHRRYVATLRAASSRVAERARSV